MSEIHDGKEYTEGIAVKGGFLGKLDNFWYHNKWVTIIVSFFLCVGIICTLQTCSKKKEDLILVYAGRNTLSATEIEKICSVLENAAPSDFDGDGEKNIALSTYTVMSEGQIKEAQKETDAEGRSTFIDGTYISKQYDDYCNYLLTGESSVLFLDPWLYENLSSNKRLVKLEDVLGYKPEEACGEYGVALGKTSLYSEYGVMRLLPEDTVICLLQPYVAGKSSKEKFYVREQEMFRALVGYRTEE